MAQIWDKYIFAATFQDLSDKHLNIQQKVCLFQTCINTEIRSAKKNSEFSKGEGIAVLQRSEFQKFFPFRSQEAVHW